MRTYCNNSPVNFFDDTGDLPQCVEDAVVHNKVLKEICEQNEALRKRETCIYYNGKDFRDGWVFCDLYNAETGEVWELKKDSDSLSCTTTAANAQLNSYISGRLKHHPDLQLFRPYLTRIKEGTCHLSMNGYDYYIKYWNEGQGILRYSYTKQKKDYRKKLEVAAAVVIVAAATVCYAPSLPAVAPLIYYTMY